MTDKRFNIVFGVCHPDDEVLWAGGLLCELARLEKFRTYVICLSGLDETSPRMAEFESAKRTAGYTAGVIRGGKLRGANDPLPPTPITLADGLMELKLQPEDIDLLITHAPFGDEHCNPHHVQAHRELKTWCAARAIGFAHFACIQLPGIAHKSMLSDLRRRGTLRLLQLTRCTGRRAPRYYVQFMTDISAKIRLVQCYQSIGQSEHDDGYTMFSNPCEALYLQDERALRPIMALIESMRVPGATPLVRAKSFTRGALSRLRRLLLRERS